MRGHDDAPYEAARGADGSMGSSTHRLEYFPL